MKLVEVSDGIVAAARAVKAERVREVKGRPGQTDIVPTLHLMRGHDPTALIFLGGKVDRDVMIGAAQAAAMGFRADVLTLVTESWRSSLLENPITGREWEPDEMQALAEHHDGLAKGWVTEALSIVSVNRAGDVEFASHEYKLAGRRLDWGHVMSTGIPGVEAGGYMLDGLRWCMEQPDLGHALAEYGATPERVGLDRDDFEFRQDAAMLEAWGTRFPDCVIGLYAIPGSRRHQLLRERFPASQIIDPRDHQ